MVKVSLSNCNPHATYKKAILDLKTQRCIMDDSEEIAFQSLGKVGFTHALLTHSTAPKEQCVFVYEYDDFDGLLHAAKFIYGILVRAYHPDKCQITVKPSKRYLRVKKSYLIPFSADYTKAAKILLSLDTFNTVVSQVQGHAFQFQDCLVLDTTLTMADLPAEVNGDLLYQPNQEITEFCRQEDEIDRYEVRYMGRELGFGVYARKNIRKGTMIGQYTGVQKANDLEDIAYAYSQYNSGFKWHTNARYYGNITRFINHAMHASERGFAVQNKGVRGANIIPVRHNVQGNNVVIYFADEDIAIGAPLLVDYGVDYYGHDANILLLTQNAKLIDSQGKKIANCIAARRALLRIMANCGVKQARIALMRRPVMALLLSMALVLGLNQMAKSLDFWYAI